MPVSSVPMYARIMQYETGRMREDEQIEFFQDLIDCGLAWQLQGYYSRTAVALIRSGQCILRDVERPS